MNKFNLLLLLMSLLGSAHAKTLGCGVETIPKAQIEYGCGCGYWAETKPSLMPVLQSDIGYKNPHMFIDGKLVEVVPQAIEDIPLKPNIGDTFLQTFKYETTKITFNNTISFVCPPASEGCEVLRFETKLSISNMQCKSPIHEITGDCGC